MGQTTQIVDTLKKALKTHGKTYADVAQALELTEASVKRLFSERNFSLQRLDQVCRMLDMEITDLVTLMSQDARKVSVLSEEQEREIAADVSLLLVALCALNRWSLNDIRRQFAFSEAECIAKLAQLDRLRVIELLPGNRIKLRVAVDFHWRENGPIQRFFHEKVEQAFFASRFDRDSERLICVNGMLADGSNSLFQRKMEALAREFHQLNKDDAALPVASRDGTTVVLAMRQWKYGLFEALTRK